MIQEETHRELCEKSSKFTPDVRSRQDWENLRAVKNAAAAERMFQVSRYVKRWNREVKRLRKGLHPRFLWSDDELMLIEAEAALVSPPPAIFGQPTQKRRRLST